MTGTKVFSRILGADQVVLVGEGAWSTVHDLPDQSELRLEAPGTYTSGNPVHQTAGVQPGTEPASAFPTSSAWGYVLAGRLDYNNAIGAVNARRRASPSRRTSSGISPGPGGNFIEGRKALTVGLGFQYRINWECDLSYTELLRRGPLQPDQRPRLRRGQRQVLLLRQSVMRSTARFVTTVSLRSWSPRARPLHGGPRPSRAAALAANLTPLGGEKAGNADGTIPAWDGGITKPPAGYTPGRHYVDPFAADKPLFTITQQNAGQYAAQLSEGHKAMLKTYPSFKMNVYPTRRSASAPQRIYDATASNVGRRRSWSNGGNGVDGAAGGPAVPDAEERRRGDLEPPAALPRRDRWAAG